MEGDAGTRQLNPTDAEDAPDESVAVTEQEQISEDDQDSPTPEIAEDAADRRPPRLGRGWAAAICAALLLLTAAAVVGGLFFIRDYRQTEAIARDDGGRSGSRQGLCGGDARPRHRSDVGGPGEDHGMLDRRLRCTGQLVQRSSG